MPGPALGAARADPGLQRGADGVSPGKLTAAGRAWATGTLLAGSKHETDDDAAFWGIAPGLLRDTDDTSGIWESNVPAVTAFLSIDSQFRLTGIGQGGLLAVGLDYQGVQAGFALSGRSVTPALWADIQMIEAGAVAALNAPRPGGRVQ